MTSKRKVYLFDSVNLLDFLLIILIYRHLGEVKYLDFTQAHNRFVSFLIKNGYVENCLEYYNFSKRSEGIDVFLKGNEILDKERKFLSRLLTPGVGVEDSHLLFNKIHSEHYFRYLVVGSYITSLANCQLSVSSLPFYRFSDNKEFVNLLSVSVKSLQDKFKAFVGTLYVAGSVLFAGRPGAQRNFKVVIFHPHNLFFGFKGRRSYDLWVKECGIDKKQVCFLLNLEPPIGFLESEEGKDYYFFSLANNPLKLTFSTKIAFLRKLTDLALGLWKLSFAWEYASSMNALCKYESFLTSHRVQKLIYTNCEDYQQIIFNSLVRRHGARSAYYSLFLGGQYLYAKTESEFKDCKTYLWAFQNMDEFWTMNDLSLKYTEMHSPHKTQYKSIGCIYSNLVLREREDVTNKYFFEKRKRFKRAISVFDTSFVIENDVFPTMFDGLNFYKDIARLAKQFPEVLFFIKPAKEDSYYQSCFSAGGRVKEISLEIISVCGELRKFENVEWVYPTAADNVGMMACSDIVITHCMSSPTAEGLGAQIPSFWYESSSKHSKVLYSKIPNLIVQGYDQLLERVTVIFDQLDIEDCSLVESAVPEIVANNEDKALDYIADWIG